MDSWRLFYVLQLLVLLQSSIGSVLRLCAFNVQVFGQKKMSKPGMAEVLSKVIRRCDVMLIQEIRDSSSDAVEQLLTAVNAKSEEYDLVLSPRLGRSTSKEQYGFFFRKTEVVLTPKYLVDGELGAAFARPPYIVEVWPANSGSWRSSPLALIPLHATPSDVFKELSSLEKVYQDYSNKFFLGGASALVLGDLNAGCGYLSDRKRAELSLPHFRWYIDDDADTTVANGRCPYDRFLAAGDAESMILKDSASVFRFDAEYGLDAKSVKEVSDHYPIEILLQWPNADLELTLPMALIMIVSVFILGWFLGSYKPTCLLRSRGPPAKSREPGLRSQETPGIAMRRF